MIDGALGIYAKPNLKGKGDILLKMILDFAKYEQTLIKIKCEVYVTNHKAIQLDISSGNAHQIYQKTSQIIFENMIPKFLHQSLQPIKQSGKETIFRRRTPDQSNLMTQSFNSLCFHYDLH